MTASHKNAGFDLLERLQGAADAARAMTDASDAGISGAVVISTCNRFEAYLDVDVPEGQSPIEPVHSALRIVADTADLAPSELRSTVDLVHGQAVAHHLFSVASGLESVVVGEGEISGQVKRALTRAHGEGTTTPELERLFQSAARTSRRVKNDTRLGAEGRSLVRLSLELASSRISDWSGVRVLLVGTGRYAAASLAALRDRGAADIRVYSPSGRAAKFAKSHELDWVREDDYHAEAAAAELIVTCTTSEAFVVDPALLQAGRAALAVDDALPRLHAADAVLRAAERQLVIDLGLPRNVDPAVVDVTGVELLDLETVRIHAPLGDFDQTDAAREIVHVAAREFGHGTEALDIAPAVVALRKHLFDVLDGELERVAGRDADGRIEEALRHLVGRLLHTPMVRSRDYAARGEQAEWIAGLEAVHGVVVPGAPSQSAPKLDDLGRRRSAAFREAGTAASPSSVDGGPSAPRRPGAERSAS
nr:glutamyl-tRNA reductase [Agromyces seonyuensis]